MMGARHIRLLMTSARVVMFTCVFVLMVLFRQQRIRMTSPTQSGDVMVVDYNQLDVPQFDFEDEQEEFQGARFDSAPPRKAHVLLAPVVATDVCLVVFMNSVIANIDRRNRIRSTWGDVTVYRDAMLHGCDRVVVFFILGVPPETVMTQSTFLGAARVEQELYNDVLVVDTAESYHNLTRKELHGMLWAQQTYPRAKYYLKTDDDNFLNLFGWLEVGERLRTEANCTRGLCAAGALFPNPRVWRGKKWGVSKKEYAASEYPAICSGTGYLYLADAFHATVNKARETPLFKLEDVYFTGIVREEVNVSIVDYTKLYDFDPEKTVLEINRQKPFHTMLLSHGLPPGEWSKSWRDVYGYFVKERRILFEPTQRPDG